MKKIGKSILCITLMLSLLVGLTACDNKPVEPSKKSNDDILRVVDSGEWVGIDGYQLDESAALQQLVGEPLFEWDDVNNDIVDGVCTDWKVSSDGLTATFTVPEGMKYSTGQQVEPEDVVASIQHGLDISPYGDGYMNIESMEVSGRQVILHLSSYRSDMLYNLCGDFMCIIDKDELDTMTDDQLLWGCHPYGRFYVEEFISGSEVKLRRNEGFVTHCPFFENKGASYIKGIDVIFNVEEFTAIESLKNGEVDFVCSISIDAKDELEKDSRFKVAESSYPEICYMEINTDKGIFADPNMRLAFMLLIDREKLCELTDGGAAPAYSIIYDTMQNFSKEAKDYFKANYANDAARAIKLIEDAGWVKGADGYYAKDGKVFEVEYSPYSGSQSEMLAEGLQGQMKQYGIKININALEWNYVADKAKNDEYDITREGIGWAEPILVLDILYNDPTAPDNTDEFYEKVEDIAHTINTVERTQKVGDLQKEMFDNMDVIPLYSGLTYLAYNADLKGVHFKTDGTYDINDLSW